MRQQETTEDKVRGRSRQDMAEHDRTWLNPTEHKPIQLNTIEHFFNTTEHSRKWEYTVEHDRILKNTTEHYRTQQHAANTREQLKKVMTTVTRRGSSVHTAAKVEKHTHTRQTHMTNTND